MPDLDTDSGCRDILHCRICNAIYTLGLEDLHWSMEHIQFDEFYIDDLIMSAKEGILNPEYALYRLHFNKKIVTIVIQQATALIIGGLDEENAKKFSPTSDAKKDVETLCKYILDA